MSLKIFYSLTGIALFCIGMYALIAYAHLFRKILAVNIMFTGISLFLVAIAQRSSDSNLDPVPLALVITGIVVLVSATAFAIAMVCKFYEKTELTQLPEEETYNG